MPSPSACWPRKSPHGRDHGRRHGAAHRPGHRLPAGPAQVRPERARGRQGRAGAGAVLHLRGRHPLRRQGPAAGDPRQHRRRRAHRALSMYFGCKLMAPTAGCSSCSSPTPSTMCSPTCWPSSPAAWSPACSMPCSSAAMPGAGCLVVMSLSTFAHGATQCPHPEQGNPPVHVAVGPPRQLRHALPIRSTSNWAWTTSTRPSPPPTCRRPSAASARWAYGVARCRCRSKEACIPTSTSWMPRRR